MSRFLGSRRARFGIVAIWALLSLAWVSGSESILSIAYQASVLSDADLLSIRILRTVAFLGVNGWLLYVMLGWRPLHTAMMPLRASTVLDVSPVGFAVTDASGLFRYANPMFLRLLDLGSAVVGQIDLESVLRGRLASGTAASLLAGTGRNETTVQVRYANGREVELQLTIAGIVPNGNEGYLVSAVDVTAVHRMAETSTLYGQTLNSLPGGVIICDAARPGFPIIYANSTFQAMSGYEMSDLIGIPCSILQGADRSQAGALQLGEALARQQATTVQLRNYRKSGEMFWAEITVAPIADTQGRVTHFVGLQHDITEDRRETVRLTNELYNDSITSGLSRAGFVKDFSTLLEDPANTGVLLVRIALQSFHEFNTALGWDTGDALLEEVAARLRRAAAGHVVGRIESNQFGVAMPVAPADAPATVEMIRDALQVRYTLPGTTCEPVIAIGWTVGSTGIGYRELMQQSTVALTEARARQTGITQQFDADINARIVERRRLTAELKQAIHDENFVVHYQPRVDMASGRIIAAEALMRWNHPLFGLQWPARFVALAEETGLIIEIGEISLMHAARVAAAINHGRADILPISVNVSVAQFRRKSFFALVETALAQANAAPNWLQLELTESIYAAPTPDLRATLDKIHQLGIGLTIDDFATGYSSQQYLADNPIDEIKIDRSFIAGLGHDGVAHAVIKSILSLAEAKDARVTAEGVETQRQREILLELGCTMGQGFLFSPPLPQEEFVALVQRDATLPDAWPSKAA